MAFKALEDAIETLKKRMGLVERASTDNATDIAALTARADNSKEWAAKGGPSSITAAYKTVWAKGLDSGGSLDAHTATDGIIIGETGIYECIAYQRGGPSATAGSDYIGLALNGDRATFESRTTGIWTHDHSPGNNMFAVSTYIGQLNAGEKVTAGAPSTSNLLLYGAETHRGTLTVRRIS